MGKNRCVRWKSTQKGVDLEADGFGFNLELDQQRTLMEVIAEFLGDVRFEVQARRHRIICDQPADNGGSDEGMTPPEFLLASLATCAAYYVAQYLKLRQISAEGLKVRVTAEKAQQPTRLKSFLIEVMVPGLDERHRAPVLRAAKSCLIHNTLLNPPSIEIVVSTVDGSTT